MVRLMGDWVARPRSMAWPASQSWTSSSSAATTIQAGPSLPSDSRDIIVADRTMWPSRCLRSTALLRTLGASRHSASPGCQERPPANSTSTGWPTISSDR